MWWSEQVKCSGWSKAKCSAVNSTTCLLTDPAHEPYSRTLGLVEADLHAAAVAQPSRSATQPTTRTPAPTPTLPHGPARRYCRRLLACTQAAVRALSLVPDPWSLVLTLLTNPDPRG